MTRRRLVPSGVLVSAFWAAACNGGGTHPPGPPADLVPGGGGQSWYFNNPLPAPLSVTVLDIDGRPVPGVVVMWTVTSGDSSGAVNQTTAQDRNGARDSHLHCRRQLHAFQMR